MARRRCDAQFKQRGGGGSTRDLNGAATTRRAILTARRQFDALCKRHGGDLTRDLNCAAAIRRAI
jgi:hypothetical protein